MTVNLSALLSCLTKKTKTNPESVKEDFVCRKRGEGQDKAFNNIVLLIKAHWKKKKKKMEQLVTENAVSSKANEICPCWLQCAQPQTRLMYGETAVVCRPWQIKQE